jgi:hypothetical protein
MSLCQGSHKANRQHCGDFTTQPPPFGFGGTGFRALRGGYQRPKDPKRLRQHGILPAMCEKNNSTRTWSPLRLLRRVVAAAAAVITAAGSAAAQEPALRPAVALDPATAIVDAFRTHQTTTFANLPRLQRDVTSWRIPSLALLRGTAIGAAGYETFLGPPPPVDYFRANPRIEDQLRYW